MSKVKQKIEIDGVSYGTGSIGMKDSTYKELPANMKYGNKLSTLAHFRGCVNSGEFKGSFTIGNHSGYLFKYKNDNVLVDENIRMFLAAFKDKVDVPIHIEETENDKEESKKDKNNPSITITNNHLLQIDDLTIDLTNIKLGDHYLERCEERLYITDEKYARRYMINSIVNGEYLGVTKDKKGKEAHLFANNGKGVFISLDGQYVASTYEFDERDVLSKPKKLIRVTMEKKIKQLKQKLSKKYRENKLKSFTINDELNELDKKLYFVRSQSRKLAYQARVNALNEEKKLMEEEYNQIAKEVNDFTKSMIPFV